MQAPAIQAGRHPGVGRQGYALTLAAGIACALLGLLVIAAWHLDLTRIIQVRASYRPMPYDSAVGFALCGFALVALALRQRLAPRLIAGAVLLIATAAVLGFALGRDLSLERLVGFPSLFAGRPRAARVPPNAVLSFALSAAALWFVTSRHRRDHHVALLGSVIAGIGVTSLLGYATQLSSAYTWAGFAPMAVHGAAAFVVIGFTFTGIAWTEATASPGEPPTWLPVPVGLAVGTVSVVLWQALIDDGRTILAHATLGTGLALACVMALAVHYGQAARRGLRQVEKAARDLEAEVQERRRVEAALRDSEERLRAIFDRAGVGIVEVGADDRLIAVNDRVSEILGYPRERLLGMATRELIAPEDRSGADELEARLREGRCERFQNETRYVRADGSALWVHLTVVAIRDAGGRVTRRIATIEDVSERKRAEVALGEANRRKDEFVAELARSNEELERFAYVASHDLQEPLRTVASFTQLLARRYRDKLDSEANEFIHFTLDAVARMQALIDALLALSRVGTHGRPLQPTRSEDTLTDALRDLSGQIHKTGAAVTHDPLPTVMADPVQLGQVFRNLLSNALKFRSEQPPRIHVSARQEHDHWIFSMADNGIGISEEHFERIFVIFLRLHTRQEFPGTGLGLAMCKKIVERHGGRIWVESTPQRGSVFHFSLPVAAASEPASGSVALPGWRSTLRGSP